jgi:hypothetical protein
MQLSSHHPPRTYSILPAIYASIYYRYHPLPWKRHYHYRNTSLSRSMSLSRTMNLSKDKPQNNHMKSRNQNNKTIFDWPPLLESSATHVYY